MVVVLLVALHDVGQVGVLGQVGQDLLVLAAIEDQRELVGLKDVRRQYPGFGDVARGRENRVHCYLQRVLHHIRYDSCQQWRA